MKLYYFLRLLNNTIYEKLQKILIKQNKNEKKCKNVNNWKYVRWMNNESIINVKNE